MQGIICTPVQQWFEEWSMEIQDKPTYFQWHWLDTGMIDWEKDLQDLKKKIHREAYVSSQEQAMVLIVMVLKAGDGTLLIQKIRRISSCPIRVLYMENPLYISQEDQRYIEEEEKKCLLAGADDFQILGRNPELYNIKLTRMILREKQKNTGVYISGMIVELPFQKKVLYHGQTIVLTEKEFGVLHELLKTGNEILSKQDILENVWGREYKGNIRTIDTIIKQLRKKLKLCSNPQIGDVHILTHYQQGYSMEYEIPHEK